MMVSLFLTHSIVLVSWTLWRRLINLWNGMQLLLINLSHYKILGIEDVTASSIFHWKLLVLFIGFIHVFTPTCTSTRPLDLGNLPNLCIPSGSIPEILIGQIRRKFFPCRSLILIARSGNTWWLLFSMNVSRGHCLLLIGFTFIHSRWFSNKCSKYRKELYQFLIILIIIYDGKCKLNVNVF